MLKLLLVILYNELKCHKKIYLDRVAYNSYFFLRNTDSDGLENFFGQIKSCCQIAVKPTITQYKAGYATMIFNNLMGAKSISSNCEEDSSIPLLQNIEDLIMQSILDTEESNTTDNDIECEENKLLEDVIFDPQFTEKEFNFCENASLSFISNLICRKIFEKTVCPSCRNNLQTHTELKEHAIIKLRNNNDDLSYPSSSFITKFKKIFCYVTEMIPHICSEKSI